MLIKLMLIKKKECTHPDHPFAFTINPSHRYDTVKKKKNRYLLHKQRDDLDGSTIPTPNLHLDGVRKSDSLEYFQLT